MTEIKALEEMVASLKAMYRQACDWRDAEILKLRKELDAEKRAALTFAGIIAGIDTQEELDEWMKQHPAVADALAERDALREQVGKLALLLDQQLGTPCEQIRHQQVVSNIRAVLDELILEAKDNIHSDDWQQGVRYACAEVLGCLE